MRVHNGLNLAASVAVMVMAVLVTGSGASGQARAAIGVQPQTQPQDPGGPSFTEGMQVRGPHLSVQQARSLAVAEFGNAILQHPVAIAYGTFRDNAYVRSTVSRGGRWAALMPGALRSVDSVSRAPVHKTYSVRRYGP